MSFVTERGQCTMDLNGFRWVSMKHGVEVMPEFQESKPCHHGFCHGYYTNVAILRVFGD